MAFAVPDLAGFGAACLLLVLAVAIGLLASLLANTLGHAPLIGSWVTGNLVGWLNDARNGVLKAADATWHFATGMVNWLVDITTKPLLYTAEFAIRVWDDVLTLKNVLIPEALNSAANYAASARAAAETYAEGIVSTADRHLTAAIGAGAAVTQTLFHDAETYAAGLVTTAEHDINATISAVQHAEAGALTAVESALAAGITATAATAARDLAGLAGSANADIAALARDITAEGQAVAAGAAASLAAVQGGIYTDLESWGDQAVARAWPDAAGDIASLRRTLGADFPWLSDLTGALAGLGTAGLAGALIRSIAGAQAITRLADECIVPNCRNLSGLGNDLKNLSGMFADGLIIAWLASAVIDPRSWAAEADLLLSPISNEAVTAARSLLGVS